MALPGLNLERFEITTMNKVIDFSKKNSEGAGSRWGRKSSLDT
jgi:hypothetical protein